MGVSTSVHFHKGCDGRATYGPAYDGLTIIATREPPETDDEVTLFLTDAVWGEIAAAVAARQAHVG